MVLESMWVQIKYQLVLALKPTSTMSLPGTKEEGMMMVNNERVFVSDRSDRVA